MIQAMYSGITGMKAFKTQLDVIGNNIANVNTTAYKAESISFQETLTQTIKGASAPTSDNGGINPSQVGLGVAVGTINIDNSQGNKTATGKDTDLAVDGNGYFVLGNSDSVAYTRDGSFALDSQYNLVSSSSGMKVLGWQADLNTGVLDTSKAVASDSGIKIPVGGLSLAQQTSKVTLAGNLDASAADNTEYKMQFDVYDSLGVTHQVHVKFKKLPVDETVTPAVKPSTWGYEVTSPDVTGTITSGNIAFDDKGYSTLDTINLSMTLATPDGSKDPLVASINVGDLSQLDATTSSVNMSYQDGLALGTLESYGIDSSGTIVGTFTNGSSRTLGQIALAGFNNPAGLDRVGNNLVMESPNSGNAIIGVPGTNGIGTVSSGYLEASNVDLANEFANMITAQRGFQANSRIITTSDEVLQELVSLKR
ncbi:MAG: flagellar hook protein FlgE [Armatimonadota bacterium]